MKRTRLIPTTKHDGFTLMELMIVVAIIAILTMAAIPGLNDYLSTTGLNVHLNNYEAAQRFVANECGKAVAGGSKAKIVETLNKNGKTKAPRNDADADAFAATADPTDASGQVIITGLTNDLVVPGTNVVISLGTVPVKGATPDQYPGGTATDMPGASTINCASN